MSGNKTHSLKHSLAYSQWDFRQDPSSHCCITQKYAVKSAAVFAISAADRVFACSKPASGRGALTHEYCLWCDGPGTFTIASSFTVLHENYSIRAGLGKTVISSQYFPPPQYQECERVTLTERWRVWLLVCGGATPDINTIEIILWSRLGFYTNTVTLLLPLLSLGSLATKNWTQRWLWAQREKSKHDSEIHKASNPCSSIIWTEGKAKKYSLRDGRPCTEKFSWIKKNLVQSVFVQKLLNFWFW